MNRLFAILMVLVLFCCSCTANPTDAPSKALSTASTVALGEILPTDDFIRACNLNSGGYMGYFNGIFYFTNYQRENRLYAYNTKTNEAYCVDDTPNDSTSMITVVDDGILFVRAKKLDMVVSSSLYEIKYKSELCKYDGKTISVLTAENVLSYSVSDEYIFYSTANLKIYRMRHDGTDKTAVIDDLDYAMDVQVSDGKLYIHNHERIGVVDYSGKIEKWRDLRNLKLAINKGAIYYIDTDVTLAAKELKRLPSFDEKEETIIDEAVENFCIYKEEFIYEQPKSLLSSINNIGEDKYIGSGFSPLVISDNNFVATSHNSNFDRDCISIYLNRELFAVIDDNTFCII